jgi:hypothetical protein
MDLAISYIFKEFLSVYEAGRLTFSFTSTWKATIWAWRLAQICLSNSRGGVKVKVILWHDCTGTEWRWMCRSNPIPTYALKAGGWSAPRSCHFTLRKDPVLFVEETGWASGTVWKAHKISPSPGFDYRLVQPAASCYTDDAIPTATRKVVG